MATALTSKNRDMKMYPRIKNTWVKKYGLKKYMDFLESKHARKMIKNEPFEVAFSAIRRYECTPFVAENEASYDIFFDHFMCIFQFHTCLYIKIYGWIFPCIF